MKDKELHKNSSKGNSVSEEKNAEANHNLKGQLFRTQDETNSEYNSSVLQVLFKNEVYLRKYQAKIEVFLKNLLEDGEHFTVYCPATNNTEQEFEEVHQSFHIDKHESDSCNVPEVPKNIPFYSSTFEDILKDDDSEAEEKKPQLLTCFNCLGSHHLKQCPEKIDRSRILANKKNLMKGSTERYHKEEKSNVEPGNISSDLRKALSLKNNQLPHFIYHMRVLGYPPGWMAEAKFETSGIYLYDQEGRVVSEDNVLSDKGTVYDGEKFVNFPGFNTPVPNGVTDEWKLLKMPPIQPHQQLSEALKSSNIINPVNMHKRKRPSSTPVDGSKKGKNEIDDINSSGLDWTPECESTPKQHSTTTANRNSMEKIHCASISQSSGTPILKQSNPFKKLPEAEKFAQGITEHLPFENLPDAVGKYEKMRGVIGSVQKKLNDIYNIS